MAVGSWRARQLPQQGPGKGGQRGRQVGPCCCRPPLRRCMRDHRGTAARLRCYRWWHWCPSRNPICGSTHGGRIWCPRPRCQSRRPPPSCPPPSRAPPPRPASRRSVRRRGGPERACPSVCETRPPAFPSRCSAGCRLAGACPGPSSQTWVSPCCLGTHAVQLRIQLALTDASKAQNTCIGVPRLPLYLSNLAPPHARPGWAANGLSEPCVPAIRSWLTYGF